MLYSIALGIITQIVNSFYVGGGVCISGDLKNENIHTYPGSNMLSCRKELSLNRHLFRFFHDSSANLLLKTNCTQLLANYVYCRINLEYSVLGGVVGIYACFWNFQM